MTQIAPSRGAPLTSPFTIACVAVVLLFGPADGNAAPSAPATGQQAAAGLLHGEAGPQLLAAFCGRGPREEFADYALLLSPGG